MVIVIIVIQNLNYLVLLQIIVVRLVTLYKMMEIADLVLSSVQKEVYKLKLKAKQYAKLVLIGVIKATPLMEVNVLDIITFVLQALKISVQDVSGRALIAP